MSSCPLKNDIHMALQDLCLYVFLLIMTFPEFDGLYKSLVSHVGISLGTCPIMSEFSVKLFRCNVC